MGKTAIKILQNRMMTGLIIADLICWVGLIVLGFHWARCPLGW
jgi:hypothetical protein